MNKQYFLHGQCDIVGSDCYGQHQVWRGGVPFELRTVGSKRYHEAEMAGHSVSKVIRVPELGMPLNNCSVVIGADEYQIVQVQEIMDSNPRCLQLSLEQGNAAWAAAQEG